MKKLFIFSFFMLISTLSYAENTDVLVEAIQNKDYATVKALILEGADMDKLNKDSYCGWDYIPDDKMRKVVKEAFLEKKIPQDILNDKFEAFFKDAARYGNCFFDKLKTLIYAGADVNYIFVPEGITALQFTLTDKYWGKGQMSSPDFIEGMLKAGTNVNQQDSEGKTALMYEVENNKGSGVSSSEADRVKVLLKYGADVHIKDNSQMTALTMDRVFNRRSEGLITQALKKAGAKRNLTEEWWLTLYTLWNDRSDYEYAIEDLKKDRANVNTQARYDVYPYSENGIEGNGQTALMYLTKRQQVSQVSTLIELGAKVDLKDDSGKNALHYLALSDRSCNARDVRMQEITLGNLFQYFIDAGLDIATLDNDGKTAFDYAVNNQPILAMDIYKKSPLEDQKMMAKAMFKVTGTESEKELVNDFKVSLSRADTTALDKPVLLNPNRIHNEKWSIGRDRLMSSSVSGTTYFFSECGRFSYFNFYSGGMYSSRFAVGTYEYDPKLQEITLKVSDRLDIEPHGSFLRAGPPAKLVASPVFKREKTDNVFLPFTGPARIDSLTLYATINDKPFDVISVDKKGVNSIVDVIKLIDQYEPCNKESQYIRDAVKLSVRFARANDAPGIPAMKWNAPLIYASIYPKLNLIEYGREMYRMDSEAVELVQFNEMLDTLLSK